MTPSPVQVTPKASASTHTPASMTLKATPSTSTPVARLHQKPLVAPSSPMPVAAASSSPTPAASSKSVAAAPIKVTKDTIDGILKHQLNSEQVKLYEFCKKILANYNAEFDQGGIDRSLFEIFLDIYQKLLSISDTMTAKDINIF